MRFKVLAGAADQPLVRQGGQGIVVELGRYGANPI
jgi:hypothetical protein